MYFLLTHLDLIFIILIPLLIFIGWVCMLYAFWRARKNPNAFEGQTENRANDMEVPRGYSYKEELEKEMWDPFYADHPENMYYDDHRRTDFLT